MVHIVKLSGNLLQKANGCPSGIEAFLEEQNSIDYFLG
jgi:hypothetical protein